MPDLSFIALLLTAFSFLIHSAFLFFIPAVAARLNVFGLDTTYAYILLLFYFILLWIPILLRNIVFDKRKSYMDEKEEH